jgi:hypothetical protein
MASIVINGDTSGSVTLQAPATAGATVLTLPSTSGTVLTTASGQWITSGSNIYYNTGNVGIGTTSPSSRLQVAAPPSSGAVSNGLAITNSGSGSGTGSSLFIGYNTGVGTYTSLSGFFDGVGTSLAFGTSVSAGSTAVTEQMRLTGNGLLQFNSGYGSVATAYGCRAWVNFNGTGTVAIRGSGNVSSITDNGTGDYTVNFTTAMPDANYNVVFGAGSTTSLSGIYFATGREAQTSPTTSAYRLGTINSNAYADLGYVYAAFFR